MISILLFLVCVSSALCADSIDFDSVMPTQFLNSKAIFANHNHVYLTGVNPEQPLLSLASIREFNNKKGQFICFKADGLIPEEVTLDYKEKVSNPLFKQSIEHMVLQGALPIIVTKQEPASLYYMQSAGTVVSLLPCKNLADAQGNESAGIVKICTASTYTGAYNNYIIAAVKNHKGVFGQPGSGFSLIKFNTTTDLSTKSLFVPKEKKIDGPAVAVKQEEEKKYLFLDSLDDQGATQGNKALDISACFDALSVNGGLDSIVKNGVDMCWDAALNTLYCAFCVKTKDDATPNQGACALASAKLVQDKLVFQPIVLKSALNNCWSMFSVTGPNAYVSLHAVRTMHTSTGLTYLIVVGGTGKPEDINTKRTVQALPLLISGNNDLIAADDSPVVPVYIGTPSIVFDHRAFTKPAQQPEDLQAFDDLAGMVGAGDSLPSDITAVQIIHDAVYVIVKQSEKTGQSGIYHSQPIFNGSGAIAAWTPWRCVMRSDFSIIAMDLNPTDGTLRVIEEQSSENESHIMIRKTGWHEAKDVSDFFKQEEGGIQGLFDFPTMHGPIHVYSLLVATGNKKVAVTVQTPLESTTHYFSGGDLDDIGPIKTATLITTENDKQQWLFVGGFGGLAVLCNRDGSGWSTRSLPDFSKMSFKKIGNYTVIQKLMSDMQNLYVVSQSRVERIAVHEHNNALQLGQSFCLADSLQSLPYPCCIHDAGISGACVLLATSKGLCISTQTSDARHAESINDMQWQNVDLPLVHESVHRLYFLTATGQENCFAYLGQVYVLTHSLHDKSHVYRFFIKNNTLVPVPDHFKKTRAHDYFCTFGSKKQFFIPEGSLYMHTHNSSATTKPEILFLAEGIVGGRGIHNGYGGRAHVSLEQFETINALVRNSVTGNLMVAGDFGLRILQ